MSPPRLTLFESGASQALDALAHRVLDADCIAVHPCDGSQHVAAADKLVVPKSNGAVP